MGMQKDSNLYEAYNLSFDGTASTVIDTGIYLFTAENINRDFEFTAEGILGPNVSHNETIICARHNNRQLGFMVRTGYSTSAYKGTIYVKPSPNIATVIVRRINGVITLSGENIANPAVQFNNTAFDWPLVLGCAIENDGTRYRFATGTIDHVKVRWL